MMFRKEDILLLLQKNPQILKNFMAELATAAYMFQQRLELLSYSGIAQKAAFYLLMQQRQTGNTSVQIPDSVSKWAMSMNVSRPSLHRELLLYLLHLLFHDMVHSIIVSKCTNGLSNSIFQTCPRL